MARTGVLVLIASICQIEKREVCLARTFVLG